MKVQDVRIFPFLKTESEKGEKKHCLSMGAFLVLITTLGNRRSDYSSHFMDEEIQMKRNN
jgi:hypothetical protein